MRDRLERQTNVPIQGALDCLEKRLREFHYSSIEIEEILDLVKMKSTLTK